ncbi:fatty acid--CoA ligase family protein [Marinobacter sp.]|uniref:ANL family adenylate-forming protein n=1 Tax=Marinobacter sp. TaxID=50741 RepID=UPI0023573A7B|nr:fatty acid--CoA ligase family protein [Marinobacter sp.]
MILEELLTKTSDEQVLWISPEEQTSVGGLRHGIDACRNLLRGIDASRVALELADSIGALTWMIALEGIAEVVFLVPDSLRSSDEYRALKARFQPTLSVDESFAEKASEKCSDLPVSPKTDARTRWVLATSGTTGTPKLIEHSTDSLTKTCKVDTGRGREFTWGLVYDPFRFAGLQVVLQALASGSPLVLCNHIGNVKDQAAFLRENNANAMSATPTYWRKLLMSGILGNHRFRQITLGGEPADQSILNALKAAFPEARIAHIYASTEAGVGFSVTDGLMGFPEQYLERGVAGNKLRISESGTLLIKPEKHAPSAGGTSLTNSDGFIDSGDLVAVRDKRVLFLGRDSGAINVGGNKVIPEEVEAVIREVEGVAEVLVKPKGSGVMGQLVTAEIQPIRADADTTALKKQIMTHCRTRLERYKVPALIRFVAEIEHNPTGKISRT